MLFLCPAPPNGCRATQHHNRQCIHQQASSMCCMLWLRASMPSPSSTTQLPPPASCMCTVKHMQIGTSPKQCRCTQQVSCCRFLWQPGPSPRTVDARSSFLWQAGPSPQNEDACGRFSMAGRSLTTKCRCAQQFPMAGRSLTTQCRCAQQFSMASRSLTTKCRCAQQFSMAGRSLTTKCKCVRQVFMAGRSLTTTVTRYHHHCEHVISRSQWHISTSSQL